MYYDVSHADKDQTNEKIIRPIAMICLVAFVSVIIEFASCWENDAP